MYCLKCIYSYIKFNVTKWGDPELYQSKKVAFHLINAWLHLEYSQVSNRRDVWNSRRWGWKKYQKLIVGGGGSWNSRKGWKKVKLLIARGEGWLLYCFFLSFSSHENCSIKNICVYSKSKIKTKGTKEQNVEHFKMINWRLFSHKFF